MKQRGKVIPERTEKALTGGVLYWHIRIVLDVPEVPRNSRSSRLLHSKPVRRTQKKLGRLNLS